MTASATDVSPRRRRTQGLAWARAGAVIALAWVIVARIAGPSDLWDQVQRRTVGYTVDIIVNGRWVLPRDRGVEPATKPPLYNWLAVAPVRGLGFSSEVGHKLPSLAALVAGWALVIVMGRSLGGARAATTGWLAGMMFVSNYTIFKLGYLARPDMLLTFWTILGFWSATMVLVGEPGARGRRRWCALFWICVAAAALTKGPAAVVLPVYALVAGLVLGNVGALGWWWGVPLSLATFGAWVLAVWRVDPQHLVHGLWFSEFVGRVSGLGPEGADDGPWEIVTGAPNMLVYYISRFAPWSVVSLLGAVVLLRRAGGRRRWRRMGTPGAVLMGAVLLVIVVIVLYSLSAGKRADYLAGAFGPGALVAAWWASWAATRLPSARTWMLPALATLLLVGVTIRNERQPVAPAPHFGDDIMAFVREVEAATAADGAPVTCCLVGENHVQAMLGISRPEGSSRDGYGDLEALLDRGRPFWLVAGRRGRPPEAFDEWLSASLDGWTIERRAQTPRFPRRSGWPGRVTLFRVEPAGR
jgi:4-amino-4-deoxy-L-arabinose transferase-like glycosyltransferase